MLIDGIHTVKDDSVIGEDGTKPFTVPSHNNEYSKVVGGATVWRRRRYDRLWKGSKLQPKGVEVGFTEHLIQRDDGDFKAVSSTCDMTGEEKAKVACYLYERPYLSWAERQADAERKRQRKTEEEVYGKEAAAAAHTSATPLESLVASQVKDAVAGLAAEMHAKDKRIAELEKAAAKVKPGPRTTAKP